MLIYQKMQSTRCDVTLFFPSAHVCLLLPLLPLSLSPFLTDAVFHSCLELLHFLQWLIPFLVFWFSLYILSLMIFPHCNRLSKAHKWEKTGDKDSWSCPIFFKMLLKSIFFASSLVCVPLFVSCYMLLSPTTSICSFFLLFQGLS